MLASINMSTVLMTVSDDMKIECSESGDVFFEKQCSNMSEVLVAVAQFAIGEYRCSPIDAEYSCITVAE